MIKVIFILISSILMISLAACTEDVKKPISKNSEQIATQSNAQNKIDDKSEATEQHASTSVQNKSYNNYRVELELPGEALSPDMLSNYLPKHIAGTTRSEPNTGTIYGEKGDVTTVSYTYSMKKGGLVIVLTDYGRRENIPSYDVKYFDIKPEEPTKEIELIMDETGKGYIFWDAELRNGTMYYLLANRFIIKLEAYTLPSGIDIISFFDRVNKDGLIKKAKQ